CTYANGCFSLTTAKRMALTWGIKTIAIILFLAGLNVMVGAAARLDIMYLLARLGTGALFLLLPPRT
ncbi:hypothetical protein, partial [Bacillus sp. ISL-46]|uniref:hypothetical protein n=1 Tax=Bacillus sp. ISL-46 TaxID=2819129 RepID=UPI001BE52B1E